MRTALRQVGELLRLSRASGGPIGGRDYGSGIGSTGSTGGNAGNGGDFPPLPGDADDADDSHDADAGRRRHSPRPGMHIALATILLIISVFCALSLNRGNGAIVGGANTGQPPTSTATSPFDRTYPVMVATATSYALTPTVTTGPGTPTPISAPTDTPAPTPTATDTPTPTPTDTPTDTPTP